MLPHSYRTPSWFSRLRRPPILIIIFLIIFLFFSYTLLTPSHTSLITLLTSNDDMLQSMMDLDDGDEEWNAMSQLHHLILVAGHAVLISRSIDVNDERAWWLHEYQKGQVTTYIAHIRHGVELLKQDTQALLIFTGGQTRREAGPRSEAQSYYEVCESSHWFTDTSSTSLSLRTTTEEYAKDSYENVLYSIARFKEVTGNYPTRITVVGFSFKKERFDWHRRAIRYPSEAWTYVGIDPKDGMDLSRGESATFDAYKNDPYGCSGFTHRKRHQRNPWRRTPSYLITCSALRDLLLYCQTPKNEIWYQGKLPWT